MSTKPATIKLSPRRLDQLKAIGAARDLSVTDAIAFMIRDQIAAGTIPADIPGIIVRKVDAGVSITADDHAPANYSNESARELASTIRAVVEGGSGVVNMDHRFAVFRRGTGFKIALPFPGPETVFTADLALDLAGLVEQAAA